MSGYLNTEKKEVSMGSSLHYYKGIICRKAVYRIRHGYIDIVAKLPPPISITSERKLKIS